MSKTVISLVMMLFLLLFAAVEVDAHQKVKNLSLNAAGIEELEVECGAGFLKIYGEEGLNRIEVEAEIILDGMDRDKAEGFIQNRVRLALDKHGNTAFLRSEMDSKFSLFSWGNRVINLTVRIPRRLALEIDDGSGSIWVENIRDDVVIDDGSGEMHIRMIEGNVEIDDGSGEMEIYDINGDLEIDDGSGEIDAENIQGRINISDGSGTIRIREAVGDVTIRDGSGSIIVDRIQRDVIIRSDGSGSVDISRVEGRVIR